MFMDLRSLARTFWASFLSSLKVVLRAISFRGLIAFNLSVPFFFILTSWITQKMMGGGDFFIGMTQMPHFLSFVTIGFAFNGFIFSATFGGAQALRGDQQHGTLELIFVTPANKLVWLMGKIMGNLTFSLINFAVILLLGSLLFGFQSAAQPNIVLAVLFVLLTIIAMTSFGFVFAGICFVAKREDELGQVVWTTMVFLSGLAFPVEVLPSQELQAIAWMIPITHGVQATRQALLLGAGFLDPAILTALGMLILQTVVLLPIGIMLYSRLEKKARATGALATY
jgi:ABC-2 type transport system permease protein